jgi:hypothetical protein
MRQAFERGGQFVQIAAVVFVVFLVFFGPLVLGLEGAAFFVEGRFVDGGAFEGRARGISCLAGRVDIRLIVVLFVFEDVQSQGSVLDNAVASYSFLF